MIIFRKVHLQVNLPISMVARFFAHMLFLYSAFSYSKKIIRSPWYWAYISNYMLPIWFLLKNVFARACRISTETSKKYWNNQQCICVYTVMMLFNVSIDSEFPTNWKCSQIFKEITIYSKMQKIKCTLLDNMVYFLFWNVGKWRISFEVEIHFTSFMFKAWIYSNN